MRKLIHILALSLLFTTLSCERRPLLEMSNTHYIRVYIDEVIPNVTTGFYNESNRRPTYNAPGILRVTLADPETGAAKAERFLRNMGMDENGRYYDGYIVADPGVYSLMVYNFDVETTQVKDINNHFDAKAFTGEIASHLKSNIPSRSRRNSTKQKNQGFDKVVYDPDHMFRVACPDVLVPYVDFVDTLKTPEGKYFRAESMVQSYYLQVRVKGLEFASSSVGLLTGVAGSGWLMDGRMDKEDPVTVYFDMFPGQGPASGMVKGDEGTVTVYTTFNTFGKIPAQQNHLEVTFDFLTVYGDPYSETLDITDVFATKEAQENRWLLIDHTIEIPEPPKVGGGGFDPGLDDWKDVESDVII